MHYLITGATGLIGMALVKKLLTPDNQITVLTRSISKAKTLLNNEVRLITSLGQNEIEKADVVVNLAGEPIADKRWSKAQKEKICQSRWQITQQLTAFIQQANNPPSVYISGSAIGIYGRQHDEVITEDFTEFHQEFTHQVCSTWEKAALKAQSDKTRVAVVRTGIVLSQNGGALAKMLLPFKLGLGGKISHGEQIMSWIHIEDMVKAIIHIVNTTNLQGAINITAEHAVSNQKFSAALAQQLKRPCLLTTPSFILKMVFGEMADLLLYGQNVYPKKLINSGFTFKYNTIEAAFNNLL